uniref:Uncharacterized protein n=1 Tax=Arundo donax TaxID=35708 RepID=A0A0A9B2I5_ARUDO
MNDTMSPMMLLTPVWSCTRTAILL